MCPIGQACARDDSIESEGIGGSSRLCRERHGPLAMQARTLALTLAAMVAFAGNSLLTRAALQDTTIDAASFTLIRLASGAAVLWLIVALRASPSRDRGHWISAMALFVYMAGFSFAYRELSAATGALLLFGAVQATMIGRGLSLGERLGMGAVAGLILAAGGVILLFLPGVATPPPRGAAAMLTAGLAWGVYSLRGHGVVDATRATAGNFLLALPPAGVVVLALGGPAWDLAGVLYAVASGAVASGIGYAIWYVALPNLRSSQAGAVQLSVPVLTALGGVVWLDEALTWRLGVASLAILGGIALVMRQRAAA